MSNLTTLTDPRGRFNLLTASWLTRVVLSFFALTLLWGAIYWATLLP
jgi:hypothetical protein